MINNKIKINTSQVIENLTKVSHEVIFDERLSMAELGMLCSFLS